MLNPLTYTDDVVRDFLKYQMTTYGFADAALNAQLRTLLSLGNTRESPLMKGPFISLSRAFRQGAAISDMIAEGLLHPHFATLIPYSHVRGHQEDALRSIKANRPTLVATGTGSGKTECFLYPIIDHALRLRDQGAGEGISAVIVYPMNALAADQLKRLRELLAGSGITFGMYVGSTPERMVDVTGRRLGPGASAADWQKATNDAQTRQDQTVVIPPEERASREELRARPPRILLTNVKQLELLLTRQTDVELFRDPQLKFIVFDEAHTFSGALGAESAALVRRLRAFCNRAPDEVTPIATSATIADPVRGAEAGREFASRFFGVPSESVTLVGEAYESDDWAAELVVSDPLPGDPAVQLGYVFDAVREMEGEKPSEAALRVFLGIVRSLTGKNIGKTRWAEDLYTVLAGNRVVFELAELLAKPRDLADLVAALAVRVGRAVPQEEVLIWLALGSVARRDGRPLLRPVVHVFVRGMAGAVVTFPDGDDGPRLWLSAEDADKATAVGRRFPILSCTTCGQHYYHTRLEDFDFTGRLPGGGRATDAGRYWQPLEAAAGAQRVVFLDRVASSGDEGTSDDQAPNEDDDAPGGTSELGVCTICGAFHASKHEECLGCGVSGKIRTMHVVRQKEKRAGFLHQCVSCGAAGRMMRGTYREPARPVRATAVADVHVLAQNMLHRAERPRLLVFADNRQDAAFQAGWMLDHARRYRLRALMWEALRGGAASASELVSALDTVLEADDALSQALVPEVWAVERKTPTSGTHEKERKLFLRIQVARELGLGLRQRIGLEPWGRLGVDYLGLEHDTAWFRARASELGCTTEELRDGVALLLDVGRRSGALYDGDSMVFTQRFDGGTRLVQRGYVPEMQGLPVGVKFQREDGDKQNIKQWWGRSTTRSRQIVQAWGVGAEQAEAFLQDVWNLVTSDELRLLVPVTLAWGNGQAIPGLVGAHQLDMDRLALRPREGRYRCETCRRVQLRAGPQSACIQWRCTGRVRKEDERPDDYDLMVLDQRFRLIRPREHSAQVPAVRRTEYENWFKNEKVEIVNTLVATPTLEVGVDIGSLDAVLMRNVPPLPANYWQRAGRAGRRHRMSVNVTYAHARSHDRAYFEDPLKLLGGLIHPPRFNLKNELMVRKHVHATILTILHGAARDGSDRTEAVRNEIRAALDRCFPKQVSTWLFDAAGNVRPGKYDISVLRTVVERERVGIDAHLDRVFATWPEEDRDVVTHERLREFVDGMTGALEEVVARLQARLSWALDQLKRLRKVADLKGTLDPDEESLRTRAELLVNRLKGRDGRRKQDAEGFDETYTMAVLAAEGFLPGYGLDGGGVVGSFATPWFSKLRDFDLRRPTAVALREFAPGNLIYANGLTFSARNYRFPPDRALTFEVDQEHEAVTEKGLSAADIGSIRENFALDAMPISDCDLPHRAHITDEDESRFQLPVSVLGHAKPRHSGGEGWQWGERTVQLRRQQHLRLVNVGASSEVRAGRLGYPLCVHCGTARSPFASDAELKNFEERHVERCGHKPRRLGLYADIVADAMFIEGCETKSEAWSIGEALRQGASDVLDMERDDLIGLVLGNTGEERMTLVIYDPMPGGSGLLEQMLERWEEVVAAAARIVDDCPGRCEVSCVDCLRHYRNQWAHDHLHRALAGECFRAWGMGLTGRHDIPPRMEGGGSDPRTVGVPAEMLLKMFDRAGFPPPTVEHRIELPRPLSYTDVDFFFTDGSGRTNGICVYVDGLSKEIHGNAEAAARDGAIRDELRNQEYEVFVISASEVTERAAVVGLFARIARRLLGKEHADGLKSNDTWIEGIVE